MLGVGRVQLYGRFGAGLCLGCSAGNAHVDDVICVPVVMMMMMMMVVMTMMMMMVMMPFAYQNTLSHSHGAKI